MNEKKEKPKLGSLRGCLVWTVAILAVYVVSFVVLNAYDKQIPRGGMIERVLEVVYFPLFILWLMLGLIQWK